MVTFIFRLGTKKAFVAQFKCSCTCSGSSKVVQQKLCLKKFLVHGSDILYVQGIRKGKD